MIGEGAARRKLLRPIEPDREVAQREQPVTAFGESVGADGKVARINIWIYRDKCIFVDGEDSYRDDDEVVLRIKHAVLKYENGLERIEREVRAFENMSAAVPAAQRERIPDEVRLFVWQRDQGKCVRCGSDQRLEFDHIIPVAKGGSNTERNIQLLCEACNRSKGASI